MKKFFVSIYILISLMAMTAGCRAVKFQGLSSEDSLGALSGKQEQKIRVYERLKYSIRWMGVEVGTAEGKVEGIEKVKGRDAYHISLRVLSNSVINLIYPVVDEHHTYIDVKDLHTLRYEKNLQEGRYRANEVTEYDQEGHTALFHALRSGDQKEMLIPKHVQDQLSCGYWFRLQPMKPSDTIHIPVNADEKNWDLQVDILKYNRLQIENLGYFDAVEVEPHAKFQGVFVRRGKVRAWQGIDERRIPLMMQTTIPVLGTVSAILVEYE
ncbi:MAG: hypothetical protein A3G33_10085 [Omnitrophica bacterium RIFCSPLOWO2_12_FULL_44_17]|uniref:DUF3108 domain-containing protein n=1 Tax=Candidatus Danuiimicrobium aquiferis TaxID=1801832 RepID=A0A1G1L200_9BACT|nr:MAG: hypothetical protein A3B72_08525 [Omnitrophica bacterium RIFCSPHIGHO2_02_FULL_45_28]OGW91297.1 MAG: hypothetical protein A3E74_10040 [Omnitrophica bacterium RIFCSPHIGHO2_12_FULL_44_12]OGW99171.1 MAG: hypothetical protein A3G33_10085 [Omnitrophica bacterium RIFCSPLOWO2_12_FULL_44_17]OGX04413.1 MAG: hypothetical protein A3J12_00525 [Omnitrophica bacterium RIFCSPLOWO2_02_FULL_44_11]